MTWQTFDPDDIDIDGRLSNGNFAHEDSRWVGRYEYQYDPEHRIHPEPVYLYKFRTKEDLICSDVFQQCLKQALAFKDENIRSLQQELLNLEYNLSGTCSR